MSLVLSRTARAAALGLALVLAACGGKARGPAGPAPDDAIVTLECPVRDAEIWVNGEYFDLVGHVAGRGIALSPGREHRIVFRHDRYHDRYFVLELERKERRTLEVRLAEILP